MARSSSNRSVMPGFTTSLRWMTPRTAAAVGDDERGAAVGGDPLDDRRRARRARCRPARRPSAAPSRRRPCGCCAGPVDEVDAAHAGLGGERDQLGAVELAVAAGRSAPRPATTIERPSGVSSARLDEQRGRRPARPRSTPGDREELGGLAVAEGDGAGLVEQQGRAVAGRLDGPARHGQHVALHQAVHAGDADGRQQGADRGRDEADQQGDQHDDRLLGAGVDGERLQRDRRPAGR